jgi:transposase-like protein
MFFDRLAFESFCEHFNSDQVCADALFEARWPDGFRCPACGHSHFYHIRTRRLPLYECRSCRHQTSVIAGTIMEGSSTPLPRWFQAMFLLSRPSGISSAALSKVIQVTYKTAWLIARKIRHALQQADESEPLTGVVGINHSYYGYAYYDDARQPLLIGGSLDEHGQAQHVKIKQPDPCHVSSEPTRRIGKPGVESFINQHTDSRDVTVFPRFGKLQPVLNQINRQMRDWLNDTFHGIGPKHLQAYLDEFCFRLNLKLRNIPVLAELLHWCATTPTRIYKDLTRNKPVLAAPWLAWGSKAKWKGNHLSRWSA